ncbi:MAG: hypothetical protein LBH25_09150 [Fibromonadaceae bacterium]|jgi:hypothetical protein|nr:hypothetical protein [Fibromonadaceae bacterium]
MLENAATQDFSIEHAICFEKQLQTTDADLYGGEAQNLPGAGDKIPAEANAEFQKGTEYYTDASMNGTQFNGNKRKTAELPTLGSLNVKGYTQGLERILLAALGYAKVDGPSPIQDGYYKHFFIVPPKGKNQRRYTQEEKDAAGNSYSDADFINLYLCVSQKLGPYAQHARNVAVKDLEIACSAKSPLQITISGPAERIDMDETKAGTENWSYGANFNEWFQLSDFKCYISKAGETLSQVSVTEFSAKASHGISEDNTPTGTSNNGLSRAEPMPSGKSTITLDLTIYLHNKAIYENWEKDEAVLQCKLEAVRGLYKFAILFPRLQITQTQPNFDGAGSIQLSMEASVPSNMEELQNSFGEDWPGASVMGVAVVSKENRNPMRGMEVTVLS